VQGNAERRKERNCLGALGPRGATHAELSCGRNLRPGTNAPSFADPHALVDAVLKARGKPHLLNLDRCQFTAQRSLLNQQACVRISNTKANARPDAVAIAGSGSPAASSPAPNLTSCPFAKNRWTSCASRNRRPEGANVFQDPRARWSGVYGSRLQTTTPEIAFMRAA
jgi:hypothetical protein